MDIRGLCAMVWDWKADFPTNKIFIASEVLKRKSEKELCFSRNRLGLLSANRPPWTLSGGEAQRIRLATQDRYAARWASCNILDEPALACTSGIRCAVLSKPFKVVRDFGKFPFWVVEAWNKDMMLESWLHPRHGPGCWPTWWIFVAAGPPNRRFWNPPEANCQLPLWKSLDSQFRKPKEKLR